MIETQKYETKIVSSTVDDANHNKEKTSTVEKPISRERSGSGDKTHVSAEKRSDEEQQLSGKNELCKSEESNEDSEATMPKLRQRRERRAVRRSQSTMEWGSTAPAAPAKAKLSSQSLNVPRGPDSSSLPVLQQSTSSCSDWYVNKASL